MRDGPLVIEAPLLTEACFQPHQLDDVGLLEKLEACFLYGMRRIGRLRFTANLQDVHGTFAIH